MKFVATFAAFVMAVATTSASECTLSEMHDVTLKPELLALEPACGSLNIDSSKTEATRVKLICANPTCFAAVEKLANVLPDCTVQGISLSGKYQQVVADCKKSGASSSSATTPAASSGAKATSPVSAAAAAVTVTAALAVFARV